MLVTRLNFFLMKKVFDKVVCVSCDIKTRFAQRYGFNPELLAVVHNGINLPAFKNRPDKGGPFCIGTAGRLFPIKDFPLFIKIADKILKADRNVHFLLAGDGPERLYLQKLVDRCRLSDRFKFLGHIENMSTFYKRIGSLLEHLRPRRPSDEHPRSHGARHTSGRACNRGVVRNHRTRAKRLPDQKP